MEEQAKMTGHTSQTRSSVAFLGPTGTYGHQAATAFMKHMEEDASYVACPDITSIYHTVADYLVMPIQNAIHGAVTETLDCLLSSLPGPSKASFGHKCRIIGDLNLPIRHCLVVRKGTRMEDIKWVRSHEQALGQSAIFLRDNLPKATTQRWPSTAGAAMSLLDESDPSVNVAHGAAICSKAVLEGYSDQLECIYEGTQGIDSNCTRFLLLALQASRSIPPFNDSGPSTHFFALESPTDLTALLSSEIGESQDIKQRVISIHSRPSSLVEVDGEVVETRHRHRRRYPNSVLVELQHLVKPPDNQRNSIIYLGSTSIRLDVT